MTDVICHDIGRVIGQFRPADALDPGGHPLSLGGNIRRRLLGVSLEEAHFQRRGFVADSSRLQRHLEQHAETFLDGYHAALQAGDCVELEQSLQSIEIDRQGFAYEGAAMALVLLDRITPWRRNRWRTFRDGPGEPHVYMMHVGAGWAMARLRVHPDRMLRGFDPLLRWLVLDGYGFHQGFFETRENAFGQAHGAALKGYTRCAFDQGIGRSLWFSQGAAPQAIHDRVTGFGVDRRGDLWSGVGLAAAYAGGVGEDELRTLIDLAQGYEAELGQGCAFAAKARLRAGNVVPHTETACRVLLGCSVTTAADWCDEALHDVVGSEASPTKSSPTASVDASVPSYDLWRRGVRRRISAQGVHV